MCFWINRKWCTLRSTCVYSYLCWYSAASPIELSTSRTEALQAPTALCELTRLSLNHFSIVHSKRLVIRRGPPGALIVVFHVFSWPPFRLHHVRGGVGRGMSCTIGTSFFARAVSVYKWDGGTAVPPLACNPCALRVKYGGCCHGQRPRASFRQLLKLATSSIRKAELNTSRPSRPCSLCTMIFQVETHPQIVSPILIRWNATLPMYHFASSYSLFFFVHVLLHLSG